MQTLFWAFFSLIIYCYFGYPFFLIILTKLLKKPVAKGPYEASISIVLSAFNEEDTIEKKVNNLLSLTYPSDNMEILIGSDGSTDQTNTIVKKFSDRRIQLLESDERKGKMVTMNELVRRAKNELIIFIDARQILNKNAIQELVMNFADPKVGCVSGELLFANKKEGATANGINLYWSYEKFLRKKEAQIHSMLGATGAIYAIRRELYTPIPENIVLDDMFVPLKIIQKGYRAVFDESTQAFDEVANSSREEHRRKARTLYGNYQIFGVFGSLFNPFKSPIAIQLFSHKFLRVVAPFLIIGLFFINYILLDILFYKIIFGLQIIFYGMAVLGAGTRHYKKGAMGTISKICYIPYVFCLLNFSALIGFIRFIRTKQKVTWEKAKT